MLGKAILLAAVIATLAIVIQAIRRRQLRFGGGLGFRSLMTSLFSEALPDGAEHYLPDTGALTRQILKAMRSLGHSSITHSARALAPHLHVEGAPDDVNAILDFQEAILTDIEAYVAANGRRCHWTLTEKPTLTLSIASDGTPGVLRITRGRSPRGARPKDTIETSSSAGGAGSSRKGVYDASAHSTATRTVSPVGAGFDGATPLTAGVRLGATRRIVPVLERGADSSPVAQMRLFRVGGGNVYRLTPGMNIVGRDPSRCDIVLGFDDAVSAVHAEIAVLDDGTVTIRDLGSSNGTTLAGKPVAGTTTHLAHGDVVTVGTTRLRFIHGNAPLVSTEKVIDNG